MNMNDVIRMRRLVDRPFEEAKLSATRHLLLSSLKDYQSGCSQSTLVRDTGVDRSTTAQTVKGMVRDGMVKKTRGKTLNGIKDNRITVIEITARGTKYLDQTSIIADKVEKMMIERVNPRRRQPFLDAIDDILTGDPS